jgi:hypothetical protein
MSQIYDEKRTFMRMTVDSPVRFTVDGETAPREGIARDLSAIGISITTGDPVAAGASVLITLPSASAMVAPLRVRGEVLRCSQMADNSYELGIGIKEHLPS